MGHNWNQQQLATLTQGLASLRKGNPNYEAGVSLRKKEIFKFFKDLTVTDVEGITHLLTLASFVAPYKEPEMERTPENLMDFCARHGFITFKLASKYKLNAQRIADAL